MTEPAEQTHHLETLGNPSGVDALELLPTSDRAGPERGHGGPQRDQERRQQAENCVHINPDQLRQMKDGQRVVCPVQLHQTPGDKCNPRRKKGEDVTLKETLKQLESLLIDSDTDEDARLGRKRHRCRAPRKKRNWKPYNTPRCDETKVLQERKTVRASLSEEMFMKGLLAPHNTTQYLMDEHNRDETDLRLKTRVRRSQGVGAVMEETGSSEVLVDTEEFLRRDFSEAYEMYYRESLQSMTKQERVLEYLEPEKCMSRLEEQNNRLRRTVEPRCLHGGLPGPAPGDGETEPKPRSCSCTEDMSLPNIGELNI